jgi:hypothetical protein
MKRKAVEEYTKRKVAGLKTILPGGYKITAEVYPPDSQSPGCVFIRIDGTRVTLSELQQIRKLFCTPDMQVKSLPERVLSVCLWDIPAKDFR